jgi:exopolyphosphatase / guanosine-5'-triphosphate,3'-diphosphate pyrophosphatase
MRVAVIDLGTNTFNLLIADFRDNSFVVLHSDEVPARLGEGGILKKVLTPEAMERGMKVLNQFRDEIKTHNVEKTLAFGTSALRNAQNAREFIERVKAETGIPVVKISGEEEAELIFEGVRTGIPLSDEPPDLIMDIGGGSVEFIICNKEVLLWKHSFDLGAGNLIEQFPLPDPVSPEYAEKLESFLDENLGPLWEAMKKHKPHRLIGSAGSFESLAAMCHPEFFAGREAATHYEFDVFSFETIYQILINSSAANRERVPGLPHFRVNMIVPASILINRVMSRGGLNRLFMTTFSMREGMVGVAAKTGAELR